MVRAPTTHPRIGAATSIHDAVRVKEPGLADLLVYDAYERRLRPVRVLSLEATAADWAMARADELADLVDGAFEVEARAGPADRAA